MSFRQDAVRGTVEDDEVRIRHDVNNPNDPNACVVETLDGEPLGFIPADLAVRLSGVVPSGIWRARIKEVLRGDTWGLRITVGPLLSEGQQPAAGADNRGLRHRGDGVVEMEGATSTVEVAETIEEETKEPAVVRTVWAKSGRQLGILESVSGTSIYVTNANGERSRYPAAVVLIKDPR